MHSVSKCLLFKMSNVPYLKGVRTRFVNILKKEITVALELLATDEYPVDETELILKIKSCVERLQLYSDKVENQTEKLADAIGDSDTDYIEQLVTENETVCDKAVECTRVVRKVRGHPLYN